MTRAGGKLLIPAVWLSAPGFSGRLDVWFLYSDIFAVHSPSSDSDSDPDYHFPEMAPDDPFPDNIHQGEGGATPFGRFFGGIE